jgi:hypothetical protein
MITEKEWYRIEEDYKTGEFSMRDLEAKYNVSVVTIVKRFKANNVIKGEKSEDSIKKLKKEIEFEKEKQAIETAKEIIVAKKESYDWSKAVGKAIVKTSFDIFAINDTTVQDVQRMDLLKNKMNCLKTAAFGLNSVMQQRWKALNIDALLDDNEMPSLSVENLTDEAISRRQLEKVKEMNIVTGVTLDQDEEIDVDALLEELSLDDTRNK